MGTLTYKGSGVDIDEADRFIEKIRPAAERTSRPEVLEGIGGFGGLFALNPGRYRSPVLVAGTDGVGTKLKLAFSLGMHHGIGIDLVAMCVNDILVVGAEPLFFLDYYASGKLDVEVGAQVVEGVAEGCLQAGCALLGGETAEMPGMYAAGEYDLAGFAVGVVERGAMIDGSKVSPGDVVIGLASSGLHSNGFSLARRAVEKLQIDLQDAPEELGGATIGQTLLTPTRIYVRSIRMLIAEVEVRAMAHITGGGLPGNVARSLPGGAAVQIDASAWRRPPIFDLLAGAGIPAAEQYRAFNMGVGMTVIVHSSQANQAMEVLRAGGEEALVIGEVVDRGEGPAVRLHGIDAEGELS